MKFKFNIQPIIIEADSEQEQRKSFGFSSLRFSRSFRAWDKFDRGEYDLLCNDMEEIE